MRVSNFMFLNRTQKSFQDTFSKFYVSQEQLATGLKINRPSDDVPGMAKALDYKVQIANSNQYQRNIDDAQSFLEFSDTAMSSVVENLQRMQELMVDGVNGSRGPVDREAIGKEISVIKDALYALSVSRLRNRYVFSGQLTNLSSFVTSPVAVASTGGFYVYQGDTNVMEINVNTSARVIENITGSDAFAFSLNSTISMKIGTGNFARFTPSDTVPGLVTVNISASSDPGVAGFDQFSFSNYMDMARVIEEAFQTNNVDRMNAMLKPMELSIEKTVMVRATIGARLNFMQQIHNDNEGNTFNHMTYLSNVEDADMTKTTSDISKSQVALQALRQSSSQVMFQSLLDFLK
ncbi:MAG: flagellar hook-associated protein FlgL [Nitrospirae bacterium]|nr:flagellar hook-associated protein FlgL [Nitrospirota bacterium]